MNSTAAGEISPACPTQKDPKLKGTLKGPKAQRDSKRQPNGSESDDTESILSQNSGLLPYVILCQCQVIITYLQLYFTLLNLGRFRYDQIISSDLK